MDTSSSRRRFLHAVGFGTAAVGLQGKVQGEEKRDPARPIQGFEEGPTDRNISKGWEPVSDRKIRVGIVGYGTCKFGAAFSFQDHPNVEVVAVSALQSFGRSH